MGRIYTLVFIVLFILGMVFLSRLAGAQTPLKNKDSSCDLIAKIKEDDPRLRGLVLRVGPKKYKYSEARFYPNKNGVISRINLNLSDEEREIGLNLINIETCVSSIIKITKRGKDLILPPGYDIRVVKRANGIEWNGKNTHFNVVQPASTIVLRVAWPSELIKTITERRRGKDGKIHQIKRETKSIDNLIYVPFSADDPSTLDEELGISSEELLIEGGHYLEKTVAKALQNLKDRGVHSRAFPEFIAGEIPFLPASAYSRLMIIEQMDWMEFNFDKDRTLERFLVTVGSNSKNAFNTCNSSKPWRACGPFQFTDRWRSRKPGTYSTIVRTYPGADLVSAFPAGTFDHVNAATAAILLHDYNLKNLVDIFGKDIVKDPIMLEELLAAAYNGSPNHVRDNMREYLKGNYIDWSDAKYLRDETRGYLVKLRYLIENQIP